MAHEILSVKLCELDDKIGRMVSRIHLSEYAEHHQLKHEIEALERECAEAELLLHKRLRFTKASVVSSLSRAYEEIERTIQKAKHEQHIRTPDRGIRELSTDEKILLAEFALDFAVQAADRALLLAMKAIDAQMIQQEEGSLS